jgi:hypothetical protein
MTGVDVMGARGDAPAISRRNPNENLGGCGTSGRILGSYCGPGVPLRRFSGGNLKVVGNVYPRLDPHLEIGVVRSSDVIGVLGLELRV